MSTSRRLPSWQAALQRSIPLDLRPTFPRIALLVAFALAALKEVEAGADNGQMDHEFFPSTRLFPAFVADGTAHTMSLQKDMHSRRWYGSIGGGKPLIEIRTSDVAIQLGAAASVKANFIKTSSVLQVVTVDFFVDLPVEVRLSEVLLLRTGWGHTSAHYADDGIELLKLTSVNYAKDYLPLFLAATIQPMRGFVYAGIRFDYYSIPERGKHLVLQCGAEGGNAAVAPGVTLYGAFDFKARAEASWGSTQSYQVGLRLLDQGTNAVRVYYTYRTGVAEQGQLYRQRVDLSLVGMSFEL